jgi:1,4-alpha-glucan branching enzyme
MQWMLRNHAAGPRTPGESVIVAPFDTELFGHWWHEGIDFVADLYRHLAAGPEITPRTASDHLASHPPERAIALAPGSWGANGDFSMWLNAETRWTWERLWELESRFWPVARRRIAEPACERVLAQAARELLLLQSSDWQFIISTGAAADYATRRFTGHAEDLDRLVGALERGAGTGWAAAEQEAEVLRRRDDVFPGILPVLAAVLREGR